MSDDTGEKILLGRPASPEEKFYLEWGRETFKHNLALVNDTLQRLITLTGSLSGAGVVFLKEAPMHPAFRLATMILLLASLCAALWGVFPYRAQVNLRMPDLIRVHKEQAQNVKLFRLKLSGGLLVGSFSVAIVGLVLHFL